MNCAEVLRTVVCLVSEFGLSGVTPRLQAPRPPARGGSAWTSLLFDQEWFMPAHRASLLAAVAWGRFRSNSWILRYSVARPMPRRRAAS